jgi:ATP-dependent Clp protease ATP-binding subunit ClpA
LTEAVTKHPYSVVLLDDREGIGHLNIPLQVMDTVR